MWEGGRVFIYNFKDAPMPPPKWARRRPRSNLLHGGEAAGAGGGEGAAIQTQTSLQPMISSGDDAFLGSIFRDFEDGWSI